MCFNWCVGSTINVPRAGMDTAITLKADLIVFLDLQKVRDSGQAWKKVLKMTKEMGWNVDGSQRGICGPWCWSDPSTQLTVTVLKLSGWETVWAISFHIHILFEALLRVLELTHGCFFHFVLMDACPCCLLLSLIHSSETKWWYLKQVNWCGFLMPEQH